MILKGKAMVSKVLKWHNKGNKNNETLEVNAMKGNNILSSLCYFSIFFAPFLLPIIVYFIGEDDVKYHAKKALWTHIIPYAILFGGLAVSGAFGISMGESTSVGFGIITTYVIFAIVGIYYFVWNIVKGVRVLKTV